MSKWARIDNELVAETTDVDPTGRFHGSLTWVPCSDNVVAGWGYSNGAFTAPPTPAPTTAQDLAPGRSLEGLTAEEIAAFEELAAILNTNPEALKAPMETANG